MRLGDVDSLKEEIVKLCEHINANKGITVPTLAFTRIIDNAPIVANSYELGYEDGRKVYLRELNESFNKGYEAAKSELQRTQGEWILDSDNLPICNKCGEIALQRIFVKMPHLIQDVRMVRSNYCPNCGAKMKGGAE